MRAHALILLILTALLLCCTPALAHSQYTGATRTVRVGYYTIPGFQEYDANTGQYNGSGYEYLQAVAQYANWCYVFVPVSFREGVAMLEKGELDLMNNVAKTPDREKLLSFSVYPSGENYACLAMNKDDFRVSYGDYGAIGGLTVALIRSSIYNDYFLEKCAEQGYRPTIRYYETGEATKAAVASGEADACIITNSQNVDMRIVSRFAPLPFYMATTKGNNGLLLELNSAMSSIQVDMPEIAFALQQKYHTIPVEKQVVLTPAEQLYLKAKKKIRIACEENWYPISYFDQNGFSGPLAAIYRLLFQKINVDYEFVPYANYALAVESVRKNETDILCDAPFDFKFSTDNQLGITRPFTTISVYRVTNGDKSGSNAKELKKNERVAVRPYTYAFRKIREIYGDSIVFVDCPDTQTCIDAVLNGTADSTYIYSYQAALYQSQGKYLPLQYEVIPQMDYQLCTAVSKSEPNLLSIVSKGLSTISENDVASCFQTANDLTYKEDFSKLLYRYPYLFVSLGVMLAALVVILVYYRMIRKKNLELGRLNSELVAVGKAKEDFFARMSHDIRTPMNAIIGITALALDETDNPAGITRDLEKISSASHFLLGLINDILDMTKIEEGNIQINLAPYRYSDFIGNLRVMFEPLCQQNGIRFLVGDMTENLTILTDKVRLNQIFFNVLSNAVKFTPEGGTVSYYTKNLRREGNTISADYIISDTGIGMGDDFQKYMFQPFAQENNTITPQLQGTGLGLAITKSLVELMGGRLQIKSALGKGTTVIIHMSFKLAPEEDTPQETIRITDATGFKGRRVLLAEDHPLNAEIAKRLLEKKGVSVYRAENGKNAVEQFSSSGIGFFNAILMDIRMPVMDGLSAAKAIRNLDRPDARTIPIIAMTANAYAEDTEKSLHAGMNEHLTKPIEPERLYSVLAKHFTPKPR